MKTISQAEKENKENKVIKTQKKRRAVVAVFRKKKNSVV